ncbi:MAG: hypothetical protein M1836_001922 [Candelina mexicana]|nr:MAG: hypothetical protein M1836_001922 [Candelina mexicana]
MAGLFPKLHSLPFSTADLSKSEIALLTQVLSLPTAPNGTLTRRQISSASSSLIAALPKRFRTHMPFEYTVVKFLSKRTSSIPPATVAPLCSIHSPLRTQLIHSIFTCLALEVGIRLNTLTSYMYLYPEHEAFVHSLRELHALWLAPEVYTRTFLEAVPSKWSYETSRCEGCILARVGGDAEMVCKLKVALSSRLRSNRREPLLVRWVDGWLDWLNEGKPFLQGAERKVRIEEEAKTIRKARKMAQRAKSGTTPSDHPKKSRDPFADDKRVKGPKQDQEIEAQRAKRGKTLSDHPQESQNPFDDDKRVEDSKQDQQVEPPDELPEPNGADFENSIIDHYAALMSTCHLPTQADGSRWQFAGTRRPEDEGHVHPAFRNRSTAPNRRGSTRNLTKGAATQAEEYRNLLATRERTQTRSRRTSVRDRATNMTTRTSWGNMYKD